MLAQHQVPSTFPSLCRVAKNTAQWIIDRYRMCFAPKRRRAAFTFKPRSEQLESRELMAVASVGIDYAERALVIECDDTDTEVQVSMRGFSLMVTDIGTARTFYQNSMYVDEIQFHGGSGNDRFRSDVRHLSVVARGNDGDDVLSGNDGNDRLYGGAGDDTLVGLGGDDALWGNHGNNALWGFAGDDRIWGGTGSDHIFGGSGNDHLFGAEGNDKINGGSGEDRIQGGPGDDHLIGMADRDVLLGGAGRDTLEGNSGIDWLFGQAEEDTLLGGSGNDWLFGGQGNDHLNGQAGRDRLFGQYGDDILIAIDGDTGDRLHGGQGQDALWGEITMELRTSRLFWQSATTDRISASDQFDRDNLDSVHRVRNFQHDGIRRVDRTLDGDRIAEPTFRARGYSTPRDVIFRSFRNQPLFTRYGPFSSDVRGNSGRGYQAALAAMAETSPTTIRHNVVDFNDGTYGVRLGDRFFRVDGDLPVRRSSPGELRYTGFGGGYNIWAAVVEKALAYQRGNYPYAVTTSAQEVFRAFGASRYTRGFIASYRSHLSLAEDLTTRLLVPGAIILNVRSASYIVAGTTRDPSGRITDVLIRQSGSRPTLNIDDPPTDIWEVRDSDLIRLSTRFNFRYLQQVGATFESAHFFTSR